VTTLSKIKLDPGSELTGAEGAKIATSSVNSIDNGSSKVIFNPSSTVGTYDYGGIESSTSVWTYIYTITASSGTGGSISPVSARVNYGGSQTFTITPNTGYEVNAVLVDGKTVSLTDSKYTFSNVTSDHSISVTFIHIAYSIISYAGSNGSISPSGIVAVNYGGSQTFTVTPDDGYAVNKVLVDGAPVSLTDYRYTFSNVTSNHVISVTFSQTSYFIISYAGNNGSISPSGIVTVSYGGSQTFTITPDTGYEVTKVPVDGSEVTLTDFEYTFTNVVVDHTMSVSFSKTMCTILAYAGNNGSIDPSGLVVVSYNASKTFTVTPDIGYEVNGVFVDGSSVGAVTSYTFSSVTSDHTIFVTFSQTSHIIIAYAENNGSIDPSGIVTVDYGDSKTFTITPDTGYEVNGVFVDGSSVGAVTSYTFSGVISDHTVYVAFSKIEYIITASSDTGGTITPISAKVDYGGFQTFMISTDAGYVVNRVLVDGCSVGAVTCYVFSNVTSDHTISATFTKTACVIVAYAGSNGSISPSGSVVVDYNSSHTFTVTPDIGYAVNETLVDGYRVSLTDSKYTFSDVTSDHVITVNFSQTGYMITASSGDNGCISPAGSTFVSYGNCLTYAVVPDEGYKVSDVLVDGNSVGAVTYYVFSDVTSDHTISVTFSQSTSPGGNIWAFDFLIIALFVIGVTAVHMYRKSKKS